MDLRKIAQVKIKKESPTCFKDTFCALLGLTIQNDWELQGIDIKTAFLQEEHIDREVFVIRSPKSNTAEGYLWKLKCIYGLSDASLKWYLRVKNSVNSNSGTISKVDPSLFLWYNESDELIGYILVHVDDFLFAGNIDFHKTIITKFNYLGLNVTIIAQLHSTNISTFKTEIHTDREKELTSPLNETEKDQLRAKIEH